MKYSKYIHQNSTEYDSESTSTATILFEIIPKKPSLSDLHVFYKYCCYIKDYDQFYCNTENTFIVSNDEIIFGYIGTIVAVNCDQCINSKIVQLMQNKSDTYFICHERYENIPIDMVIKLYNSLYINTKDQYVVISQVTRVNDKEMNILLKEWPEINEIHCSKIPCHIEKLLILQHKLKTIFIKNKEYMVFLLTGEEMVQFIHRLNIKFR